MNKPLFNYNGHGEIIVKPMDNLKNKSGKYSEKNSAIVGILLKCISLKGLGCNFTVDTEYGLDTYYKCKKGNFEGHDVKKVLLEKDISNALANLNLCMKDRIFVPFHNSKGEFMISCLSIEKWEGVTCLVREKGVQSEKTLEVGSVFDSEVKNTITLSVSKGLRPIKPEEISEIKSNFNAMLEVGFEKEIFKKVEKLA